MNRLIGTGLVMVLALLAPASCGEDAGSPVEPDPSTGVRIASFDFAESALLAELYAQVVESEGIPVVRLGAVGPREVVAPAMELDLIDLVPEYLGTSLQYAGEPEPNPDTSSALATLRALLAERRLTALGVASAEDKNVVVVTTDTADREGLTTISDLAPLAPTQRFGGPAECPDRPLCLAGLEAVYGLRFGEFVPQRSLTFTIEALRRGEIDVGLLFSTAPQLAADDIIELLDDRRMQPAENVVPVIRTDALDRWGPGLATGLDALSQHLTTEDLRALNAEVADDRPVDEVARRWLTGKRLVETG